MSNRTEWWLSKLHALSCNKLKYIYEIKKILKKKKKENFTSSQNFLITFFNSLNILSLRKWPWSPLPCLETDGYFWVIGEFYNFLLCAIGCTIWPLFLGELLGIERHWFQGEEPSDGGKAFGWCYRYVTTLEVKQILFLFLGLFCFFVFFP